MGPFKEGIEAAGGCPIRRVSVKFQPRTRSGVAGPTAYPPSAHRHLSVTGMLWRWPGRRKIVTVAANAVHNGTLVR